MAEKGIIFESEEPKNITEVAEFLRTLADRLAQGRVTFQKGAEEVVLLFPQNVVLEIKVEQKQKKGKTKHHLEIEIEWVEGENTGPVSIS